MNKKRKRRLERKIFGCNPTLEQRKLWTQGIDPCEESDFEKSRWKILNHYLNRPFPINDSIRIVLEDLRALRNQRRKLHEYLKSLE